MSLEEIKEELDKIGAIYVVSKKDKESIKVIFPEGTTIASVPVKEGDKKGEALKKIGNYYFQYGIKIVFPARNGYRIAGILGQQVILSPF